MSIFTVQPTGVVTPIEVYGGMTALTDYLGGSSSDGAVAWRNLQSDDQKRKLVDATRFIDAQIWQGTPTGLAGGTATTLQYPRSGLTNLDGSALDPTNVPQQVINACFEMVAILSDDASAAANADSGQNVKALGAGSGRIEFFNPTRTADGTATVLPTPVDRLIGRWLAVASSAIATAFAGFATGVNPCSNFSSCCSICNSSPCCCEGRVDVGFPL